MRSVFACLSSLNVVVQPFGNTSGVRPQARSPVPCNADGHYSVRSLTQRFRSLLFVAPSDHISLVSKVPD